MFRHKPTDSGAGSAQQRPPPLPPLPQTHALRSTTPATDTKGTLNKAATNDAEDGVEDYMSDTFLAASNAEMDGHHGISGGSGAAAGGSGTMLFYFFIIYFNFWVRGCTTLRFHTQTMKHSTSFVSRLHSAGPSVC